MDLTPYLDAAMRAAPRPPLPPPMTSQSVSLVMGAIARAVVDIWRDSVLSRVEAMPLEPSDGARAKRVKGGMDNKMSLDLTASTPSVLYILVVLS